MSKNSGHNRERRKAKEAARQKRRQSFSMSESHRSLNKSFPVMKNPFENSTLEQRREYITEMGNFAKAEYQTKISSIINIVQNHDPLQILSMLSFYNLTGGISEDKGISYKQEIFGINQLC